MVHATAEWNFIKLAKSFLNSSENYFFNKNDHCDILESQEMCAIEQRNLEESWHELL